MVQLGVLSIIPYFAELILEHGPVRAITSILHQVDIQYITIVIPTKAFMY